MKKVTNTAKIPHVEWLLGGNPRAIEAQEAQGQQELVNSQQLPAKANPYSKISAKDQYEKMGIKIVGQSEGDELFVDVILPAGWRKSATNHSMWNNLLDDKGRIRAMFFYKAAFYDRDAFINFQTRYQVGHQFLEEGRKQGYYPKKAIVKDGETVIWESGIYGDTIDDKPYKEAQEWVAINFPAWQDINAYWD